MQTNPIPGVMDTLKEAGFDEDQRMAIIKANTEMHYPLLEAIEKLDTRLRHMAIAVYGLVIPVLFIVYQVAPTSG